MQKMHGLIFGIFLGTIGLPVFADELGEFTVGPVFAAATVKCPEFGYFDPDDDCRILTENFAYFKNGIGWEATAGLVTDGASIPRWARWLIGDPQDDSFSKAATLHDHYCHPDHRVRDYLTTHRMFYDALLDSGVSKIHAGTMYSAVVAFGPSWSVTVDGQVCDLVENCVKNNPFIVLDLPSLNNFDGDYDPERVQEFTKEMEMKIRSESLNVDEIEALALSVRVKQGAPTPPPVLVRAAPNQ